MKKQCFKCGVEKDIYEFYKHKQMKDGYVNKCKDCNKNDNKKNRMSKKSYYNQYDKKRYHTNPDRKKSCRGGVCKNKKTYPLLKKASTALSNAIRSKKIIKNDFCEICFSEENIQGHHIDYRRPLDVIWLCVGCHARAHSYENLVKDRFGYNNIIKI